MSKRDVDTELANMAANLEQKTGRSMSSWIETVLLSGKGKHGEMIAYLKAGHGLTHGYANLIAHNARQKEAGGPVAGADLVTAEYAGKEHLRPIYEALIRTVSKFGDDVDRCAPRRPGSASAVPSSSP